MFSPLPKETVLEAKAKARRNTVYLFCVLVFIYLIIFNLIAFLFAFFFLNSWAPFKLDFAFLISRASTTLTRHWQIGFATCFGAIFFAILHFWYARSKKNKDILASLGAVDVDLKNEKEKVFKDTVEEAEVAINMRPIQAVLIKTRGLNAFSISDLYGNSAIGITQGLLDKLDRSELSAVVAHEAAHLANQDSNLTAIAYSLFAVFNGLNNMIQFDRNEWRFLRRSRFNFSFFIFLLFFMLVKTLSEAGKFIASLLFLAISRNREYLADSQAVAMCKDPLSMAEALYKIARTDRGGMQLGGGFAAIFILNPETSLLDEKEGLFSDLFSTHPPVRQRMDRLLNWAKEDVDNLIVQINKQMISSDEQDAKLYMAHQKSKWVGPMTPEDLIRQRVAMPQTWIMNSGLLSRASSVQEFRQFFNSALLSEASNFECPRCKTLLSNQNYENIKVMGCEHCKGYLLLENVLTKIVLSHDKKFSEEEMKKAVELNALQKNTVNELCHLGPIFCPICKNPMRKSIHNQFARVVLDQCTNERCTAIWFDAGELERYQILLEENLKKFQSRSNQANPNP